MMTTFVQFMFERIVWFTGSVRLMIWSLILLEIAAAYSPTCVGRNAAFENRGASLRAVMSSSTSPYGVSNRPVKVLPSCFHRSRFPRTFLSLSSTTVDSPTDEAGASYENRTSFPAINVLKPNATLAEKMSEKTMDDDSSDKGTETSVQPGKKSNIGRTIKNRALLDFNQALNEFAEQAGSAGASSYFAIAAATQAEKMLIARSLNDETDVISLNTVLKAWGKCCSTLAGHQNRVKSVDVVETSFSEQKLQLLDLGSTLSQTMVSSIGDKKNEFNVYTATDAALHLERLLRRQIRASTIAGDTEDHAEVKQTNASNMNVVHPDTHSFNIAMNAWAVSGDPLRGLDHVENLFEQMKDTSIFKDWETAPRPDAGSYGALVDAVSNSKDPKRFDRLYEIWNEIKEYEKTDPRIRPTVKIMNSILFAFSRREIEYYNGNDRDFVYDYAEKANQILNDMKERFRLSKDVADQPDAVAYTAVMECWSRCSSYESAIKADELFKDLKQVHESMENHSSGFLQESARVQPSAYTYTTLIKAWSRAAATSNSIAPRRAEEILDELLAISVPKQQQSHPSNPNFLVIPNAVPFTAVLQCWAQSKHVPDKATKALELLKRMKSLAASMNNPSLLPTLATYNTAIDVCGRCGDVIANIQSPSSSKNQLAALQIAIAILRAIEVEGQRKDANNSTTLSFQPNAATYGKLLRAVGSLLPSGAERNKVATAVFKKAIAAGQVDMSVVRNLQKAADVEVIREFFPESGITVQNGHASNERDKIESRILQRNQGVALNTRQNSSNKGGKQFVNPESIPPAWSKNVGRIQ